MFQQVVRVNPYFHAKAQVKFRRNSCFTTGLRPGFVTRYRFLRTAATHSLMFLEGRRHQLCRDLALHAVDERLVSAKKSSTQAAATASLAIAIGPQAQRETATPGESLVGTALASRKCRCGARANALAVGSR